MREKNKIKQGKQKAVAEITARMRQTISDSWKEIDAILNNLWRTCKRNPSLLHEAILQQLALQYWKWSATDLRRTFFPSHQERPNNPRKGLKSKRSRVVSRPSKEKRGNNKDKSRVL